MKTTGLLKVAIVHAVDENGIDHTCLNCPCGRKPRINMDIEDINVCGCGQAYNQRGWIV